MGARLQAALDYADQARSVIPVEPGGKVPALAWGHFQVERATQQQIRRWWDFADFNVGIVTGRISNLIALDVDFRAGGDASLARLEAAHATVAGLEVSTPGGVHLWFSHPGGRVANSTGTLGRGLDVKADGGMIVVPPSVRPDGVYSFGRLIESTPPPLPAWLHGLLAPLAAPPPPPAPRLRRSPPRSYLAAAVRGVIADLEATTEGDRNNMLYRAACRVLELGAADAIPAVEEAARRIGLAQGEIDQTVASAQKRIGGGLTTPLQSFRPAGPLSTSSKQLVATAVAKRSVAIVAKRSVAISSLVRAADKSRELDADLAAAKRSIELVFGAVEVLDVKRHP
jgi:hypothetical protein